MNRSGDKRPAANIPDKEIALRVADVVGRIPAKFLKPGPHDTDCELRFNIREVFDKITRGRASLPLSRIAKMCPQLFRAQPGPIDDVDIPLPLQKLVEQVGIMTAPSPGPANNHAPAPPAIPDPAPESSVKSENPNEHSAPAGVVPDPAEEVPEPVTPPVAQTASGLNGTEFKTEDVISLALAPIFRLLPGSVARYAPMPDASVRIALPMQLIEPQLATGHVEIPLDDFLNALPQNLRIFLMRVPGVQVWIPLDEIFQNLPSTHNLHIGAAPEIKEAAGEAKNISEAQIGPGVNEERPSESATQPHPNGIEKESLNAIAANNDGEVGRTEPDGESQTPQSLPDQTAAEHEIAQALSKLPGVFASVARSKNGTFASAEFPGEIEIPELEALISGFGKSARDHAKPLGWTRTVTLHCEKFFATASIRDHAFLCALHRDRTLNPLVHERLVSTADELDKL